MGLLTGLTVCLSILVAAVNCDTFPECNGVPSKTFVSSPTGCESYIYCDGNDSFEGSCPSNLMFNIEDGSCDDPDNVQCDPVVTIPTTSPTTITTTVTTPPAVTTTPTGIPISTITTTTTPPTSTTTSGPVTSPGQIVCPQPSRPEEIFYLPNPESCTEYYMCYRLTPIPMTCPNGLEFNSMTGSCDWPQVANCKVIGTTTESPRELCTGQTSGYFVYPSNCHYYYRCTNGLLTIQECPIGFGWDVYRKMCTSAGCSN